MNLCRRHQNRRLRVEDRRGGVRIECGMGWRAWIVELSSLRHPERHPHHHTDPRQSGSPPGEKGSILISKESCYCIDLHRKLIQRASARISRKRYYVWSASNEVQLLVEKINIHSLTRNRPSSWSRTRGLSATKFAGLFIRLREKSALGLRNGMP